PPALSGEGELEIVEHRPWRVRARVQASGQVLAVLHTPRAPGWRVFLDGKPLPQLTANLGAMGVVVPGGTHEVTWQYWPPGLGLGLVLGFLGLIGTGVYAFRGRKRAVC
ncbi:MAG: YfhO family protein, partial [Thermoanaerobaculum sp.]